MSWANLQASLLEFGGYSVTVSVFNPQSRAETARVCAVVAVSGDGPQTLTSASFTLKPRETRSLSLTASGPIESVTDGPRPIDAA